MLVGLIFYQSLAFFYSVVRSGYILPTKQKKLRLNSYFIWVWGYFLMAYGIGGIFGNLYRF